MAIKFHKGTYLRLFSRLIQICIKIHWIRDYRRVTVTSILFLQIKRCDTASYLITLDRTQQSTVGRIFKYRTLTDSASSLWGSTPHYSIIKLQLRKNMHIHRILPISQASLKICKNSTFDPLVVPETNQPQIYINTVIVQIISIDPVRVQDNVYLEI